MKYIVIHHSAFQSKANQLQGINNYHKAKWNMKSTLGWYVGYNYLIDVDGKTINTRAIGEETMAQVGHNLDSISICLAGDFNRNLPSKAQKRSLRTLMAILEKQYPEAEPKLHRDVQANRTCPGRLFTTDYLDVIIRGLFVEADDEDKAKKKAIENELRKSITLLRALVRKLQDLLKAKK
jgi:hypothetical protein